MFYDEKYLTNHETVELAGHTVEKYDYVFPIEENVRTTERRSTIYVGNEWAVRLTGYECGEPELTFNSLNDSHVIITHNFEGGFKPSSSTSHDLDKLLKDVRNAQAALVWADALYAEWERYFSHLL